MISVYYNNGTFTNNTYPQLRIQGVQSYSHTIESIGGFKDASFSFATSDYDAEEWLFNGVGRHIRVVNIRGNIIWEGIVNSVSITLNNTDVKIGDYTNIVNRIKVAYSLRNPPLGTPDADKYLETAWAENSTSITRYGYLEEIVSGGTGYSSEMNVLRDQTLEDKAEPEISEQVSFGGRASSSKNGLVSINCVGYVELFNKQTYNYGTAPTWDDISIKFNSIVDSNLSVGYFVRNRDIRFMGMEVLEHETKSRTAWAIITDDISKGAASKDEVVCGMFANGTFVLRKTVEDDYYFRRGRDGLIYDKSNSRSTVLNSEVVPGRYMVNNDFTRPLRYYISSINYSADNDSVRLNENSRSIASAMDRRFMAGGLY